MKQLSILALSLILVAGCGNKIDLPQETGSDTVPFKNYFVYAEWGGFGQVTDIMVTRAQFVFMAEDSSTVKRYQRKGANVNGKIVAKVIGELGGFEKPVKLSEGANQHIWALDLTDDFPFEKPNELRTRAEVYEDLMDSLYLPPIGSYPARGRTGRSPVVRLYDLPAGGIAVTWTDTAWATIDTTWRLPGRDSAKIKSRIREVELTSIAADRDDRVYVSGTTLAYRADGLVTYDDNGDHVGYQVTYRDSSMQWFVRVYDSFGNYQYEAVGTGTGVGFGEEINSIAIAGDYLVYVDGVTNQIKVADPSGPHIGIAALSGAESSRPGDEDTLFSLDPGGLAGDPNGNIYITDSGNSRIQKYDPDLAFATRVDQNDPRVAATPTAIGVTDSLVYVFDEIDNKVVLFEFPKNEE